MKIVILVNYKDKNFNKDFQVSNLIMSYGHNVFLAVNDDQFKYLMSKCDKGIIGFSGKSCNFNKINNICILQGDENLISVVNDLLKIF